MESNLAYQYDAWGDEWREETVGGEVIALATPNMRHNFIVGNLYNIFSNYLRGKRCTPFSDNTKLFLEDGEKYIPDFMIVCNPDKLKNNGVHGAPDLVAEVLSPSTGKNDKGRKKDVYEKHGVKEYWIISPGDQSVEQYILTDGVFVLREVYTRYSKNMLEELTEEERDKIITEFQCSLFDDLLIRLDDIFYRVPFNIFNI